MRTCDKKAFTIVELVIVIGVIAMLAAVLIPTFSSMTDKAGISSLKQEAKNAYTQYMIEEAASENRASYFIYNKDPNRVVALNKGILLEDVFAGEAAAISALVANGKCSEYIAAETSIHHLQAVVQNDIFNALASGNINLSLTKRLAAGADAVDFTFYYSSLRIAQLSVPRGSIEDVNQDITVTLRSIPSQITPGPDETVYAYDIDVTNLKANVDAREDVTVVLVAPKALPKLKLYHNTAQVACSYNPQTGEAAFKTKSFSPFAMSYIEKTATSLAELREYTAINNAYVRIGADITMNFDDYKAWDEATMAANITHAITITAGQIGVQDVPGYEAYKVAFCGVCVRGKNVTVDLNGHELLLTGHPKPVGAMFFVSEGTLNLTDSVGGGKAKVACSTCIVWSSWTRNTGTYTNIYDGIYMADTFTGDTDPTYGYKSKYNSAMIYAGYNNEQYGCIDVYGGYFLYNNFPSDEKNTNNGAFNVGDKTTRVCLTVHEGVMLINEHWRQSTGTDDDSVALADGCEVVSVTLDTPMVIDGVSYANWYKVVTTAPRFEKVFENTDTYLYRLGNGNDIKLGSLFKSASYASNAIAANAEINVTITAVDGNVTGTYTPAATPSVWADATIRFSGTGVAKITLNGCELMVEVVNGNNATKQTDLSKAGNIILLNDIKFTTTAQYTLADKTLFGNGFTIDYNGFGNKNAHVQGVIDLSNATLDNVRIIGDAYSTFNDTSSKEYYAAAVVARGNSKITNSYISNCQVAVRTEANSLLVENTTLYGGRYANMQVKGGIVTLRNVTTVQEKKVIDGTTCLGFGVVVWEDAGTATRIIVEGTLTQHNWATRDDKAYLPGTAKNYAEAAFGYSQFVYTYNGTDYVNLGIISISSNVLSDKIIIPDSINYSKQDASGRACVVTSDKNKDGSLLSGGIPEVTEYTSTLQGAYEPTFDWSYPQGYNETSNEITIAFEQGESYTLNPNFLTVTKHGHSLPVSVSMNGTNYTNGNITFTAAGDYTLTYTVTDAYNYGANGSSTAKSYTFTVGVSVIVNAPDVKHAEFSYTSGSGARMVEIGGKTYVMPNVNGTSSTIASKIIGGVTVYMPIVTAQYKNNSSDFDAYSPIFTAINITDYSPATSAGVATTYNTSTRTMPSNLIYTGTNATAPHLNSAGTKDGPMTYSSYGLCYRGVKGADISASTQTVEYCYTDNAGQAYYYYIQYSFPAHKKPSGCFTPDTLITLADGTQKRVDQLTFGDRIMAWDFFTGTYVAKDIAILVNHGADSYEVVHTEYSDGTVLKTIAEHGVFDYDLNKFVYITAENAQSYVGHRFVKQKLSGDYEVVTMTRAYTTLEYTEAWSITSAGTSNAFAQGLLTVAPPEDFYNWIEMSGKLQYDVLQFQKDVETYGLYTYEDFKDYVTYKQFVDWNGAYLKIAVEKGYMTFDYILELIELYKGWMPHN